MEFKIMAVHGAGTATMLKVSADGYDTSAYGVVTFWASVEGDRKVVVLTYRLAESEYVTQ